MNNEVNIVTEVPAAEGKKQNFFLSALKKLNEKRKKIAVSITTAMMMSSAAAVTAFADDDGTSQFNTVITFFATWIGRIGLVVGFIGAVQFALAIKNDDAEAKTRGLMTMASGFVVFAVTKALNMFGVTA